MTRLTDRQLCSTKAPKADTPTGAIVCRVELAAEGKAPDEIMLFPAVDAEGEIKCEDGRIFRLANPEALAALFNSKGLEIPFDFDHASEWSGGAACGWIKSLAARSGAVFAQVEWLPEGAAAIESKRYRYVSPAFRVGDRAEIKSVTSAALTNRPAMSQMPALSHATGGITMDPELLKLLGLDDKATAEQIAEAVKKLQAKIAADDAAKTELEATSTKLRDELAAAKSAQPALDKFVPRSEFDAVTKKCMMLEGEKAETAKAAHKAAVDSTIDAALKAGKIAPASKDFFVRTCATAEGLEAFKVFVGGAPIIAPDNVVDPAKQTQTEQASATELELQVAANLGLTKEQLAKVAKQN